MALRPGSLLLLKTRGMPGELVAWMSVGPWLLLISGIRLIPRSILTWIGLIARCAFGSTKLVPAGIFLPLVVRGG